MVSPSFKSLLLWQQVQLLLVMQQQKQRRLLRSRCVCIWSHCCGLHREIPSRCCFVDCFSGRRDAQYCANPHLNVASPGVCQVMLCRAVQASRLVKLVQSTSLSEAAWLQLSSIWQSHSTTITAVTAAAATAGGFTSHRWCGLRVCPWLAALACG